MAIIWEKFKPELFKFGKKGDELQGILVRIEENVGQYKSQIYHFENNGKQFNFFGSKVLDDKMKYFKVGDLLKVVFEGVKKSENNTEYNDFEVYRGKEVTNE